MNKFKHILVAFLGLTIPLMADPAQPANDTITIKRSDLTPEQLAKLDQQNKIAEVTADVKTASQWAGAGKEIGIAIHDGLGAASDGVANFAATPPGKLTMFLIAWKVMAKDIIDMAGGLKHIIIAVPMLVVLNTFLVVYYWRTTKSRRVLVSSEGWFKHKTYTQEHTWFSDPKSNIDDIQSYRVAYMVCWWLVAMATNLLIICNLIY